MVRFGVARLDMAGRARPGMVRRARVRLGRLGKARIAQASCGRRGMLSYARLRFGRHGAAGVLRYGMLRLGKVGQSEAAVLLHPGSTPGCGTMIIQGHKQVKADAHR